MYLGDIEVFRTSTAEPTANGIIWTYIKEMEQYNALWEKDQKIIFDLGNLVNDIYTGDYDTSLTATFFTVPDSPPTADTILPISARLSSENMGSAFSIPGQTASVSYSLPQNVQRAVISLSVRQVTHGSYEIESLIKAIELWSGDGRVLVYKYFQLGSEYIRVNGWYFVWLLALA